MTKLYASPAIKNVFKEIYEWLLGDTCFFYKILGLNSTRANIKALELAIML